MTDAQPIIVIKKKGHHGGHHGGAWKVAYADFVTAMMSLFIVLWLLNSTPKQTQEEIAGYFRDPKGTSSKRGSEAKSAPKAEEKQPKDMDALKKQLLFAIKDVNLLNKLQKQIEVTITDEGLRVDLIEDKNGTFFQLGSAKPTPALQEILKVLSGQLKEVPNRISIEGHTDAQPYAERAGYDNWELSSDRANEARREMASDGIRSDQVFEVRGFADQELRLPDRPYDPANRRVSVVVQPLRPSVKPGVRPEARDTAAAAKPIAPNTVEVSSATAPELLSKSTAESSEQPVKKPETGSPARAGETKPGLLARMNKMIGR